MLFVFENHKIFKLQEVRDTKSLFIISLRTLQNHGRHIHGLGFLTVLAFCTKLLSYLTMMSAGSAESGDFSGKFGRRPQANLLLRSCIRWSGRWRIESYLFQSVPIRANTIMKRTIMAIMTEVYEIRTFQSFKPGHSY